MKNIKLRFLKNAEYIFTDDFWYDLTDGGYINPKYFLETKDAIRVKNAVNLLELFKCQAENNGLIKGSQNSGDKT